MLHQHKRQYHLTFLSNQTRLRVAKWGPILQGKNEIITEEIDKSFGTVLLGYMDHSKL